VREVVSDVYLMEGLRTSNVYALTAEDGLTLVDAGLTSDVEQIVAQLEERGYALQQLRTIILTHAHSDHVGGAAGLVRRSGARIVAHRDEVPYVEQTRSLRPSSLIGRVMNWLSSRLLFPMDACEVHWAVEEGDIVEALGGLEVVHTPGHTPGAISLYQRERRILFCGDALFNADPMSGRPGLDFPIRLISVDNAQARESVQRLAELPIDVLCCGHGEPILDGANEKIRALLTSEGG
jgi:glyoxylase-like metal-dependent hydrolase (beta-lactamase superfamily II)